MTPVSRDEWESLRTQLSARRPVPQSAMTARVLAAKPLTPGRAILGLLALLAVAAFIIIAPIAHAHHEAQARQWVQQAEQQWAHASCTAPCTLPASTSTTGGGHGLIRGYIIGRVLRGAVRGPWRVYRAWRMTRPWSLPLPVGGGE
jgi:hypothetical protein